MAENGIGNASSQLQMQITRDELNSTFTCKVNSTALVEPLTVDIKLDVHGEYARMYVCARVDLPYSRSDAIVPSKKRITQGR